MDVQNGSPSLRLRGGVNKNSDGKKHELNLCPSVMSPETQRLLPPTTETIMTKPFPIRVTCNFYNGKIFAVDVWNATTKLFDNFNYCECCGLETVRQLRKIKARALSNLFPKNQTAPVQSIKSLAASTIQLDKSQDLFDDFWVDNKELTLIEESPVTEDGVSSDNEKKQESMLSVSSDYISLQEEEKENIPNGRQTPEET